MQTRTLNEERALTETDTSNAVVRPPIVWALAFLAGLAVDWALPMPWLPPSWPNAWIGAGVFAAAFALALWALLTFRSAGTEVETVKPTTVIVEDGPYRFTRNPIYLGMFLSLIGLAIGFNSYWILIALVPFYLVIRYGVVAREEAYLARKFGDVYLGYKSRVRRWF
jgi:protein-S-isoprenylcysteine O-methyltransferase Ste14